MLLLEIREYEIQILYNYHGPNYLLDVLLTNFNLSILLVMTNHESILPYTIPRLDQLIQREKQPFWMPFPTLPPPFNIFLDIRTPVIPNRHPMPSIQRLAFHQL